MRSALPSSGSPPEDRHDPRRAEEQPASSHTALRLLRECGVSRRAKPRGSSSDGRGGRARGKNYAFSDRGGDGTGEAGQGARSYERQEAHEGRRTKP